MMLRISGKQLSLGHQGDDVERVQHALTALGRTVAVDERSGRVYGRSTTETVRALQLELGVEATGVIDERTVAAINDAFERAATAERIVRGRVLDEDGRLFTVGLVEVRLQRPSGEIVLATSRLDNEGTYEARYSLPVGHTGVVDLRVTVRDVSGRPLDSIPSGASVVTDAGELEVIDFVLARDERRASSELELMTADLERLLGGRTLADLREDDGVREVSLLASQSGYSVAQVAALVRAHQLARDTGVPPAVYHGLLRSGLPSTMQALLSTDPQYRERALTAAVAGGLVPREIDGRRIEDFLADVRPTSDGSELEALLGDQFEAPERARFVAEYFKHADDPEVFWKTIAEDRTFAGRAERLKLTVQLGALTNLHVPLVKALQESRDLEQARDVVRVTEDDWRALVHRAGVPVGTPGANAAEQIDAYVREILEQVEAAFPTGFFAARLGESPIARFLDEHPAYDLEKTYPERFFKENAEASRRLAPEARRELDAFHRLYRLTSRAADTIALAREGLGSSVEIARLDRDVFATRMANTLPIERAHEIHAHAARNAGLAIALFGEYAAKLDRTDLRALPRTDVDRRAELAAATIPNWETLFGSFDLCACQECNAAHGASAYFVDVLQFLRERGVKDALFARRPDLGEIELSCENTNTLVPTIDLVNEILENATAPPAPFAPFTLPAALEPDLDQPVATEALRAAFDPPLMQGTRVEVVEAGKRWRIWDEAVAYSVVKPAGDLEVIARSRQTSGTSLERRATPQYLNRAAYRELAEAVYPWTLPFDLPTAEANVFLAHLGVTRRDLVEALREMSTLLDPDAPASMRMAAEGLGLSSTQRKIIVGEALTPPRPAKDFWGGATPASLGTVRAILDRSALSFAELSQLVATRFVNPSGSVEIRAKTNERIDTCDPTKLEVDGLTAAVLDRMHRFVRLQRALGWSIPDLDRAIVALGATPPKLDDALLVRLDHLRVLSTRLRLSPSETLALWTPIDPVGPDARHAILARALDLSAVELSIAIDLTQLAPFDIGRSDEALRFVDAVDALRAAGFSFAQLDYLLHHRASGASPFVPVEADHLRTLSDLRDELQAADATTAPETAVRHRVAASLGITAELAAHLLTRVQHGGQTAERRLLDLTAVTGTLSRANASVQLEVLEKLQKVATILEAVKLPDSRLDWLFGENPWLATAPDASTSVAPFSSWSSLLDLVRFRRELSLESGALEAILGRARGHHGRIRRESSGRA